MTEQPRLAAATAIAHAAAAIKHSAFQMRQGHFLKRIKDQIPRRCLTLKLFVKEPNTVIERHYDSLGAICDHARIVAAYPAAINWS